MTRKMFVLNGPNLNMLGLREPHLYGTATLVQVRERCERVATELGYDLFFDQSNAESQVIDWVHEAVRWSAPVVINPAGLSFHSVSLMDALLMVGAPVVEVHITNIHSRNEVYRKSIVSTAARTVIAGAGIYGYEMAMRVADHLLYPGDEALDDHAVERIAG